MQIVCPELGSIAQKSTFTCPSETAAWKIKGNERLSIRNPIFDGGKILPNNSRSDNYNVTDIIPLHLRM
jgi:hypothetical protein